MNSLYIVCEWKTEKYKRRFIKSKYPVNIRPSHIIKLCGNIDFHNCFSNFTQRSFGINCVEMGVGSVIILLLQEGLLSPVDLWQNEILVQYCVIVSKPVGSLVSRLSTLICVAFYFSRTLKHLQSNTDRQIDSRVIDYLEFNWI